MVRAQCSSSVSSFPYLEDFENNNGNWLPGGTASDWSWGTPIKPVINRAGSGSKCWIIGTLTQSSYNNNEHSTLTSPCFDFTSLQHPVISFKVFWETEKRYDGANMEFSTDGGASWHLLGDRSDVISCPSGNWYNTSSITTLGGDGWSGNIQPTAACSGGAGNGSGQWVVAQHELNALAGIPNVRFRFCFAAGSVCNNYDGFAVDDIWIGEKQLAAQPGFNYACLTDITVSFTGTAQGCASYTWDFGDPASATNTATGVNPTHHFSGPGIYNITMQVTVDGTVYPAVTRQITVAAITVGITNSSCFGAKDGTASALVSPAGSYTYQWNTIPVQSASTASQLGPGIYTLLVSGTDVCTAPTQATITEPPPLQITLGSDTVICQGEQIRLYAGSFARYQWQDGTSDSFYTVSRTGRYTVTISNNRGCTASVSVFVTVDCSDIHFPSAFTPNNDGKNDDFGAAGNLQAVTDYHLTIFNRWGGLLFETRNSYQRWNGGKFNNLLPTNTYIWFAEYKLRGKPRFQKGVITLIQ